MRSKLWLLKGNRSSVRRWSPRSGHGSGLYWHPVVQKTWQMAPAPAPAAGILILVSPSASEYPDAPLCFVEMALRHLRSGPNDPPPGPEYRHDVAIFATKRND